jgi:hypothetical protein
MLSLPLRSARDADAIGAAGSAGLRPSRTVAIGAVEAFWLALIAALFVGWTMSPSAYQSRGLNGFAPGCAFAGKAGVVCNGSASAARGTIIESDSCVSLGRAGRSCLPAR